VGILIVGQSTAWTLAPALTHSAPPLDVVEGYMWGREWVVATFKHPALPSWALEASRLMTGVVGWPAYIVSQLFVAGTFAFVFLLGRDVMGERRAVAGTLLLTGVAYYAWPTPEFNHNIAELPFWAGLPWALWRAVERRGTLWWALAGVLAAGGLYAKLTTALLLVTLAAWIVWDRRAWGCLATPGPWIGLGVFVLLAAPLVLWLMQHDFAPLRYAAMRSGRARGDGPHMFVLSLLLNLAGMFAMLAIAGLIGPRRRTNRAGAITEPPLQPMNSRALHYLIWVRAGPLVLALAGALLSGSNLRSAWGSSMFNLAGLLGIALTSGRFDNTALRRIAICAGALLILVPVGYALAMIIGPTRVGAPVRVSWPQASIAERFAAIWARETGRPLRIVSGDSWIAGLVGVSSRDVPSIFTRGDPALAPWITPERLQREGMLVVWDARIRNVPEHLRGVVSAQPAREERFRWRWSDKLGDLVIGYAVIPPVPLAR
jgi:4-amino-4-deoxy-L-arabinose transferase-like glycosyltransferase